MENNKGNKTGSKRKIKKPVKIALIVCVALLLAGASVYAVGVNSAVFGSVSEAKAKTIALEQVPGAKDSDIIKCKKDFDDGRKAYDVEIIYDGYEYDFEISAEDGRVLDTSLDIADEIALETGEADGAADGSGTNTGNATYGISLEQAKSIALGQVSGAASGNIVKAHSDHDDGVHEYDIEIHYNGYEYEFEIDGATGNILSKDTDVINGSNYYDDHDDNHDND